MNEIVSVMPSETQKKSIARNTLFLYLRKVFTLIIALYSSRLLLGQLGIDEFGIYGLVGSVVAMFNALRGLFLTSIQRYINISIANNDKFEIRKVFSLGMYIHLWIAVVFFIIVEITGFFVIPYLNIPAGNYAAAQWVLLCSILSACISILTVPYDAMIIAKERFQAFALISIIEYTLRLVVILLLVVSPISKVVFYSILLLIVAIITRSINAIYCGCAFRDDIKYTRSKDKKLIKEMTVFAGWQFFGNLGYALSNNGVNFIINIFGGVAVNAARTIAYQVMNAIYQFISELNLSFQPQSMAMYAKGHLNDLYRFIYLNSKVSISISIILCFPVVMLTRWILKFWLGEVPEYSIEFVQSILVYIVIRSAHGPIDLLFKCYGKLKRYQMAELIMMLLILPLSWGALKIGLPYYSVFLIMGVVELLNLWLILIIAKQQFNFHISDYLREVTIPAGVCVMALTAVYYFNHALRIVEENAALGMIISYVLIILVITSIFVFFIIFKKTERAVIIYSIRTKFGNR